MDLAEPITEANVWDQGRWLKENHVCIDFMTRYILKHMLSFVDIKGKTTIELGCGTGRLSYLLLEQGAAHVTLVDSSRKALELSAGLFSHVDPERYTILDADILNLDRNTQYDLTFSSGVIEHFKHEDRFEIIKAHVDASRSHCLIGHPTATLYNKLFCIFPPAIKLYGFQKPFSFAEIDEYINRIERVASFEHRRFHPCYTMPGLHNFRLLNELLDSASGYRVGGQAMTHIQIKNEPDA